MKITKVETIPLAHWTKTPAQYRSYAVIKISTDEGFVGYGEASDCWGHWTPLAVKAIIDEELGRFIMGENPLEVEKLVFRMRGQVARKSGFQGLVMQAISGIEIALMDILGKSEKQPVYRLLLGSYRDKIELYASGPLSHPHTPEWHADFFEPYIKKGFKAIKIRVGFDKKWDFETVKGVRELLGDDVAIMADAGSNYTPQTAIEMSKKFAECGVYWLEEPVPEYNLEAMAKVAALSAVPIAYGEHHFTLHGFRDIITHGAADILMPDAATCGGLIEAKKICALAEAWALPVSPHSGGLTAIGTAANIHLSACPVDFPFLEYYVQPEQPLRDEILTDPLFSLENVKGGCLQLPKGTGLGIDVDESVFSKYAYEKRPNEPRMTFYGAPHL